MGRDLRGALAKREKGGYLPTLGPHLDAGNSKVRNLKLDPDGWPALHLLSFHAGEAEVGSHQVLLAALWTHTDASHPELSQTTLTAAYLSTGQTSNSRTPCLKTTNKKRATVIQPISQARRGVCEGETGNQGHIPVGLVGEGRCWFRRPHL